MLHASTDPLNPAVNHIVTRTATAAFLADGANTGGSEYSSSVDRVTLAGIDSNFLEADLFLQRHRDPASGNEELRVFFSVHDTDDHSGDMIEIYFDRRHDHGGFGDVFLDEDVMLRVERNNCAAPCTFSRIPRDAIDAFSGAGSALGISNASVLAIVPNTYPAAGVGFQEGWTGEFVLTPADLNWSSFPQVIGLYVIARSGNQNAVSAANPSPTSPPSPKVAYPESAGNADALITEADDWGNLKLRYPIDYAVVLDYSGSMLATDGLSDNRWVRAKRAADLFVAALGLFKEDMLDDQISVSQYSWSCSGNDVSGDTTGAVSGIGHSPGLIDIPLAPTGTTSFTSDNNDNPPGSNCTPIKRGIEFALNDQLNIGAALPKRDHIMILLSDGFHNMPPMDVPFDPDTDFTNSQKAFTQIRTVALGSDGSAGTDLLGEIAIAFNGGAAFTYEAKYNQAIDFKDLLQAYLEPLQAALTINQVPVVGATYSPGAPDKLVLIGVWNDASQASALMISCGGCGATQTDFVNTEIGYSAAVFDNPPGDTAWQITGAAGTFVPDNEFVLADLRILARFLVEQKPYAVGEPILLQVNLKDNGETILGADVTVEIAKPGEGLGNYLSTVQSNCEIGNPSLPERRDDVRGIQLTHGTSTASTTQPSTGDPKPGRYALAAFHFERCGKTGLDRDNLPGVKLHDDGTHGDVVPGDGIYTLAYTDGDLEGSYTFRFFALGQTSDGVDFGRTRTLSQFVGIKPDSEATTSVVQPGPVQNGMATQVIYFLPQDLLGNYMGPGFKHKFKVNVSGGQLLNGIVDLNTGYYELAVRYPQGGAEPTVTIMTTDCCFKITVGPASKTKKPHEFVLFRGDTFFDNSLGLDDGVVFGTRLNYRLNGSFFVGSELGVTTTENLLTGDSGYMFQAFANLLYEPAFLRIRGWKPYTSTGAGYVFFRGFSINDEAFSAHASAGATYDFNPLFGFRLEGRALWIDSVIGTGSTVNGQVNVGLVIRF